MPKAAVCEAVGSPISVQDVDLADPKAGEVRIRTRAAGVCHSDLSVQNGTLLQPIPAVLGHEGAGVVEQIGDGVQGLEVGDHVVVSWVPQCGECFFCSRSEPELCEVGFEALMTGGLLDGTARFSRGGEPLLQMAAAGLFSEETIVPAIGAVKIDQEIPFSSAALIGCGVLTGFGAAVNTADIAQGDNVVVLGCGGVGLNVIQGANHAGAGRVIAVDMLDSKLDLAQQFGATDIVNPTEVDATQRVMELTGGRGADVAFEVIGLEATIEQTLAMTRRGGQAVLVGVPDMEATIEVNPSMEFLVGEKQVRGCWYGSSNTHHDVPMLAALYKDGKLKLDELVSAKITLDEVNEAFTAIENGAVARSVITFD
ncbi:MAG: Zn-dependent alcohol dehydrogenase [Acidimicrobiia bacterium]|nr:Zn-dependent alcohol dehydrogenase [Acidimicrobiia bacterium]